MIAPLRVARDTWPAELKKWDHLKNLRYSVVVGTEAERKTALMAEAEIYIINRENVDWLVNKSVLWSSVFVTLVAKKYRFMQFELDMVFDTR